MKNLLRILFALIYTAISFFILKHILYDSCYHLEDFMITISMAFGVIYGSTETVKIIYYVKNCFKNENNP